MKIYHVECGQYKEIRLLLRKFGTRKLPIKLMPLLDYLGISALTYQNNYDLEIYEPQKIKDIYRMSLQAATFRAERMNLPLVREKDRLSKGLKSNFALSPYEREIEAQFSEYIKNFRN